MDIPEEIKREVLGTAPPESGEAGEIETELPPQEAADGSHEDGSPAGAESENAQGYDTLEKVLEDSEWSQEDFYNLKIKDPTSGEEVTLQDWKDAGTNAKRQADALQQQYDQQQAQLQALQQQAGQSHQADDFIQVSLGKIRAIDEAMQSPQMQELKQSDPSLAVIKMQELRDARDRTAYQGEQYWQQQQQQQQQARYQNMERAREAISRSIPAWSDPEVAQREKQAIGEAFIKYGYSQQDVASVADPRQVMIMRRLNELENMFSAGQGAAGDVRQTPQRSLRTGKFVASAKVSTAVDRAMETRNKGDIMAAARALTGARR